jgi:hypothetical protein
VSFAAINLCVASERVLIVVDDFVIGSVRKRLDTPSYIKLPVSTAVSLLSATVINNRKLIDNNCPKCAEHCQNE